MKLTKLLIVFVFLIAAANARAQTFQKELPVRVLGNFMRIKSDGEHEYGFMVELWKQGDKVYGLISAHDGLIGDPPTGVLENIRFDRRAGKISFTAKLSLGVTLDDNYKSIPTHDIFEFKGILTKTRLTGNLVVTSLFDGKSLVEKKKLNLPRSKEWSSWMERYNSYADWKKFADEILDFRGPNW